ncbi:MAG: Flp family type IVb pilin [Kineosporiaceae bacterium]
MQRTRRARSRLRPRGTVRPADRGATGLEYGLLIAGASVVTVLGVSTLGQATLDNFTCFTQRFDDPQSTAACGGAGGDGGGAGEPTPTGTSIGPTGPGPGAVQTPQAPTVRPSVTPTPTLTPSLTPTPTLTDSPGPAP